MSLGHWQPGKGGGEALRSYLSLIAELFAKDRIAERESLCLHLSTL